MSLFLVWWKLWPFSGKRRRLQITLIVINRGCKYFCSPFFFLPDFSDDFFQFSGRCSFKAQLHAKKVWKLSACSLTLLMGGTLFSLYERKIKDFWPWSFLVSNYMQSAYFSVKKNLGTWICVTTWKQQQKSHVSFDSFSLCTHPFKFSYIKEMKNCAWNDGNLGKSAWFLLARKVQKESSYWATTKLNRLT